MCDARPAAVARLRAGVSSGRRQSAVLIPVPAAEPVVARWRRLYDPVARTGVAAHVTLVVPWLPPDEIRSEDLHHLRSLVSEVKSFDFELTSVGWFGRDVLWLAPEPDDPFLALTDLVATGFGTPPWAGEFARVIPHLTIGHAIGGADLRDAEAGVRQHLPIACRAEEVRVMIGNGLRWGLRKRIPLG